MDEKHPAPCEGTAGANEETSGASHEPIFTFQEFAPGRYTYNLDVDAYHRAPSAEVSRQIREVFLQRLFNRAYVRALRA
jgi:hypothetical protein